VPRSLAFFRDGKRLAVNGSAGVQLWDISSAKLLAILRESGYEVYSTSVSPDEQTIAVGDNKGKVRLWKSPFGARPPTILGGHQAYVLGLSFSKDGRRLASAADDGTVMLWDLRPGKAVPPKTSTPAPRTAWLSPRMAHNCFPVVKMAPCRSGASALTERLVRGYADEMYALSLSADGRILATGPLTTARLVYGMSMKCRRTRNCCPWESCELHCLGPRQPNARVRGRRTPRPERHR